MSDGPDLGALLRVLDEHAVAFVVGGSVGAMAHGTPDVEPADLDVIPATDPANLRRLADALASLGVEVPVETGEWQTDAAGDFTWVKDGIERPRRHSTRATRRPSTTPSSRPTGSWTSFRLSPALTPTFGRARSACRSADARRGWRIHAG